MRNFAPLWLSLAFATAAQAGEVQVAVAANFAGPIARIGEAFTAATGHVLKVSTGSTGKFYTQIVSGAPFEVLLAADDETRESWSLKATPWPAPRSPMPSASWCCGAPRPGWSTARAPCWRPPRSACGHGNPKTAPYGAAALEVLKARGLAASLAPRLVTGESIAQAYQFVATGNAELGFVALSQVAMPGKQAVGSYVARAAKPVQRNPPGRRAAEGRREEPGRQGPARLPEERRLQADHPRHGYGL
jgi:molybdate transport system substrate-binding protein